MFLKNWSEAVKFRFSESGEYRFGNKNQIWARFLDYWDGDQDGVSSSCVYLPDTFEVLSMSICKYDTNTCYKWVNPEYRDIETNEFAYDDVKYTSIELEEDIIEKITKIVAHEPFDTRIMVPLEFDRDSMFELMMLAHKADMTLNDYVAEALQAYIDEQ